MTEIHQNKGIPSCFKITEKTLSDNSALYIIDMETIDDDFEDYIDNQLALIHSANAYNLDRTKTILRKTFNTDTEPYPVVKMGAIAEFFCPFYSFSHFRFQTRMFI